MIETLIALPHDVLAGLIGLITLIVAGIFSKTRKASKARIADAETCAKYIAAANQSIDIMDISITQLKKELVMLSDKLEEQAKRLSKASGEASAMLDHLDASAGEVHPEQQEGFANLRNSIRHLRRIADGRHKDE